MQKQTSCSFYIIYDILLRVLHERKNFSMSTGLSAGLICNFQSVKAAFKPVPIAEIVADPSKASQSLNSIFFCIHIFFLFLIKTLGFFSCWLRQTKFSFFSFCKSKEEKAEDQGTYRISRVNFQKTYVPFVQWRRITLEPSQMLN